MIDPRIGTLRNLVKVGGPFPPRFRLGRDDAAAVMAALNVTDPMRDRERLTRILLEQGAGPDNSIHGWRCREPDRFGPCDCVEQLVTALLVED